MSQSYGSSPIPSCVRIDLLPAQLYRRQFLVNIKLWRLTNHQEAKTFQTADVSVSLTLTRLIHRSIPDAFSTPRNADPIYFRDLFLRSTMHLLLWFNCVPDIWHENAIIKHQYTMELKAQTQQHPFSQEIEGWANLQRAPLLSYPVQKAFSIQPGILSFPF